MKQFGGIIDKLKAALGRSIIAKDRVIECIEKETHLTLDEKDIFIKGGTLEIHTTPVKKNIIKLREQRIIEALKMCEIPIRGILFV